MRHSCCSMSTARCASRTVVGVPVGCGVVACAAAVGCALGGLGGRNWLAEVPPLSLQPRLPHGLHCSLSSSRVHPAIGLACVPNSSRSLPPWLGQSCGSLVPGFTAWAHDSHDTESRSWHSCGVPCLGCLYTLVVLACVGPSWPHTLGFPGSWRARGAAMGTGVLELVGTYNIQLSGWGGIRRLRKPLLEW